MFKYSRGEQVRDEDGALMTVLDVWAVYKCENAHGLTDLYAEHTIQSANPVRFRVEGVESSGRFALQQWDGTHWITLHVDLLARINILYEAFHQLAQRIPHGS